MLLSVCITTSGPWIRWSWTCKVSQVDTIFLSLEWLAIYLLTFITGCSFSLQLCRIWSTCVVLNWPSWVVSQPFFIRNAQIYDPAPSLRKTSSHLVCRIFCSAYTKSHNFLLNSSAKHPFKFGAIDWNGWEPVMSSMLTKAGSYCMILNYRTTNSCSSLADMTYLDKSHPRTQNCFLKEKFNELVYQNR